MVKRLSTFFCSTAAASPTGTSPSFSGCGNWGGLRFVWLVWLVCLALVAVVAVISWLFGVGLGLVCLVCWLLWMLGCFGFVSFFFSSLVVWSFFGCLIAWLFGLVCLVWLVAWLFWVAFWFVDCFGCLVVLGLFVSLVGCFTDFTVVSLVGLFVISFGGPFLAFFVQCGGLSKRFQGAANLCLRL